MYNTLTWKLIVAKFLAHIHNSKTIKIINDLVGSKAEEVILSAKSIMIQGTGSHVGKSMIVAALCRILRQDGCHVAPFKSQNMALNSFVTKEGLEMGRAQVAQAEAAGIDPMVEMNPILLKPFNDSGSQVVIMGKPYKNMNAREYYKHSNEFLQVIKDAYDVLERQFDVIVIEGAGSPAEINIKDRDIVNMKIAEVTDSPVLLVADIDRGGAFAWIVGTLQLLSESERRRIAGVLFNKFRGDIEILKPGFKMLEDIINKPVLGAIPYINDLRIDEEDSVSLENHKNLSKINPSQQTFIVGRSEGICAPNLLDIVVVRLPRISNFTDFDPLRCEPGVSLRYISGIDEIRDPDLIIIPGTKSTIRDLNFIKDCGLANVIIEHAYNGCMIIGICGGYQMLGKEVRDLLHVESSEGRVPGLGLFNGITDFFPEKITHQSKAVFLPGSLPFNVTQQLHGYEIHMGTTSLLDQGEGDNKGQKKINSAASPLLKIVERSGKSVDIIDGVAIFNDRLSVLGTYLHGIFDNDEFRSALINYIANKRGKPTIQNNGILSSSKYKGSEFNRLARIVRNNLDIDFIYKLINLNV